MPIPPSTRSAPANAPHDNLKARTLGHHAAAEQAFARFDLARREGYEGFLRAQAAAVLPAEALADRLGIATLLPDWPSRRRGAALRSDLARLQMPAPDLPSLDAGDCDPLGLAYVLEGSRHGARVLFKRVLAGGDAASIAATAFLGQPFDRGRWSVLLDVVRHHRAGPAEQDALTQAAVFAFDLFRTGALDQPGDARQPIDPSRASPAPAGGIARSSRS